MAEAVRDQREGGISSWLAICITPASQMPIFALHEASTGPRRIDLCLGGIQHGRARDFFCGALFWPVGHELDSLYLSKGSRSWPEGASGSTTA
jgi:hypothetical protein